MDARERQEIEAQIARLRKMSVREDVDPAYKPGFDKQIQALLKQLKG